MFSILFFSYAIYQIIFNGYENKVIANEFILQKNYKNFFLFKYKNINFMVDNSNFLKNNSFDFENNWSYIFYLKGKLEKIKNLNLFNFSNQIFFKLKLEEMNFLRKENNFLISNSANENVIEYLNIIILNKSQPNSLLYKKLVSLNIIHFFTISGFHFNLIYLFIVFLFKKINKKIPFDDLIAIGFLGIYLVILNFKISAARSLLFILLIFINKHILNYKLNNITILSLCGLIIALINPFVIYSYSYILSFLITLFILIAIFIFKNYNFYLKALLVIIVAHFYSVLILHTFHEEYNIFSFFNQILLVPLISVNYILTLIFFRFNFFIEKILSFIDTLFDLLFEIAIVIKFKIPIVICLIGCLPILIWKKIKLHHQIRFEVLNTFY